MQKITSSFTLSQNNLNTIYRDITRSLLLAVVFWFSVGMSNDYPAMYESLSRSNLATIGAFLGLFLPCWIVIASLHFFGTEGTRNRYKLVYCLKTSALYSVAIFFFFRTGIEYGYSNINYFVASPGMNQTSYIISTLLGSIIAIYFVLLIGKTITGGFISGFGVKINHDTDPETDDINFIWEKDKQNG